jgi:hypothetical protein
MGVVWGLPKTKAARPPRRDRPLAVLCALRMSNKAPKSPGDGSDKGNRKAALLLSGLVASSTDGLEAFRKRKLGEDGADVARLSEVREVLEVLCETLQSGDDAAWERVKRAHEVLIEPEPVEEEPEEEPEPAEPSDSPAKPPRVGEMADDAAPLATSNKPSPWANPSASRPAPVPPRSPLMPSSPTLAPSVVPPIEPMRQAVSSTPPAEVPPPPRIASPVPVDAPAGPTTHPAPDSNPPAASEPPSTSGPPPESVTADVGALTGPLPDDKSSVLPFTAGASTAPSRPASEVTWGLPFARPGETTPSSSPPGTPLVVPPVPRQRTRTVTIDSTAIAYDMGTALARCKAEGSHLSLAHYAVLCASCGAFPRQVPQAHAKFGIASRIAREVLDRAWDLRFQQQPEAQELWQALVSTYRAWLVEHGGH